MAAYGGHPGPELQVLTGHGQPVVLREAPLWTYLWERNVALSTKRWSLGPLDSLDHGENEIEPWDFGVSWPSWPLLLQTSGMQAMRLAGTEATPLLHEVVMRGATGCCSWGKGRSGHRKGQGFMMVYSYFIDCWLAFTDAYRILWVFIVLNFKELICHLVRLPRSEEDERCSQARIFHDQCRSFL